MDIAKDRKKSRTSSVRPKEKDLPPDTRDRLIQVAKALFAAKGFDGTTVKDLSDTAGVNVSLISYHFAGKEGLYRACLERFGQARLAMAERVLQTPQSLEEVRIRLQMYVDEVFSGFLEDPDVAQIVSRECEVMNPIAQDIFKNTFLKVFETLVRFFKSAQAKGLLRKGLDMEIVAGLFFGGLVHAAQKDRINEAFFGRTLRDSKYRENVIKNAISFWLHGCVSDSSAIDSSPS